MFGHDSGNRVGHLKKIKELFSHLPDKDDKPTAVGEAGKVDLGLSNAPESAQQTGALPAHGIEKKKGFV